jgi:hypothetical protein
VSDLRQARLRGLAFHALQRGTGLIVVTRDYRETVFVDPRAVGNLTKSHVRVNKLKLLSSDPTRHDLDTLNAIHAHRRTGQQIYDAQAEAFNVATITKKFYEEYRRHYERARAVIRQVNPGVAEFQNSDQTDKLHAFTQRLLGRLMFLYFLQRKGWLGGRQRFLTEMYRETQRQHAHEVDGDSETFTYYREVLAPLFFETMNTQRPDNITQWAGIRIPYLNGGLFDESRDPKGPILIPDGLFDPNSNEGVLAFFNRYNFTIEDDTPLEQDVSVDPEMLGKVFENMLEERDRGQSGSFYTPRAIVAYMCQEALAGYLEESAAVPRETTRAQFDPDADIRYSPAEAEQINAALDTLTVLDPAVGSGSFLIGMLTEIIRLRKASYAVLNSGTDAPSTIVADWKKAIIRDTLYGVDIKPEAIEIAQLRLWLALVVDQTLDQARPLPNLDYKLMAGNSLIETIDGQPILSASAQRILNSAAKPEQPTLFEIPNEHPTFEQPALFEVAGEGATQDAHKLDALYREYFNASPERRKTLRADIRHQERMVIQAGLKDLLAPIETDSAKITKKYKDAGIAWSSADSRKYATLMEKAARLETIQHDLWRDGATLPFFLYRMHFNDVFARKGGFDVVVANPPYVRQELLGDQKPELKASYPAVYAGTADLFVYFFARAFDVLRPKGQVAFITPNKFMRAKYGTALRGYLSGSTRLHTLIDFGDLPVFDATTYPMITLAAKDSPLAADAGVAAITLTSMDALNNLPATIARAGKLPQSSLSADGWQLSDPRTRALMDKLRTAGTPLGEYVNGKIYYGIKTGFNEAFVIDAATRDALIAADPKSADVIKPYLRGRDVKRWRATWMNRYLIIPNLVKDISPYSVIVNHLNKFRSELEARAGNQEWYELQHKGIDIITLLASNNIRVIYPDIAEKPQFTVDVTGEFFLTNTSYVIGNANWFLAGILNSMVTHFYYSSLSPQIRGGYYRFFTQYIEQIPIPASPDALRDQIAALAQQCLDAAKDNPAALPTLEAQLNALVYQAYNLTPEEVALVESSVGGKSSGEADVQHGDDDEG